MHNEEAWQNFRSEALEYMSNKEKSVIKKWLDKIGYTDPVGYYRDSLNKTMIIYAQRIGCLIGKAGINVIDFEKMLSEEFYGEWKVSFVEIRGGFVNV